MFQRILIAIDDTPPAAYAAKTGLALAASWSARVTLLHVLSPGAAAASPDVSRAARLEEWRCQQGRRLLDTWHQRACADLRVNDMLLHGEPADEIVCAARDLKADLVVIGTHNHRGLPLLPLGSTAQLVIKHAPCTVMIIRRPDSAAEPAEFDEASGVGAARAAASERVLPI